MKTGGVVEPDLRRAHIDFGSYPTIDEAARSLRRDLNFTGGSSDAWLDMRVIINGEHLAIKFEQLFELMTEA
jgi:hypothetical protein